MVVVVGNHERLVTTRLSVEKVCELARRELGGSSYYDDSGRKMPACYTCPAHALAY